MNARPPMDQRYSRVAIAFHWAIAVLVVLNLASGLGGDAVAALGALFPIHKAVGITVLALTLARVAWRLAHRPPPLPAHVSRWERTAAHTVHWALYGLLILMPLSGWAMSSDPARRRPLTWFGTVDIPYLPVSSTGAGIGHEAHELLGWAMLLLVAIHVAAALRHHLLLRDSVLLRMAPAFGRR